MGQKPLFMSHLLVIGGCQLSLERNAYDSIEVIDFKNKQISELKQKLIHAVRGPTAHVINNNLWVIGGCRAQKDHIKECQILDLEDAEAKFISPIKLVKERSCHMSAYS